MQTRARHEVQASSPAFDGPTASAQVDQRIADRHAITAGTTLTKPGGEAHLGTYKPVEADTTLPALTPTVEVLTQTATRYVVEAARTMPSMGATVAVQQTMVPRRIITATERFNAPVAAVSLSRTAHYTVICLW